MARKSKEASGQAELTEQKLTEEGDLTQLQDAAKSNQAASAHSRCGGALRAARESQGLTVHEIASRLRLSAKQIDAIEADNFAALPEATIVRGFIRNYAKQLKINAQPLLDAYVVIVPSAAPHELAVKPSTDMKMSSHEKSKSGSYALAALALLLALGVWLFYQHYVEKPSPTQPSSAVNDAGENVAVEATSAPADAVLPEAALPAAERAPEPAAADTQTSTALSLPAASSALPANNPAPATTSSSTAAALPTTPLPAAQSSPSLPNSQLTASTTLSASSNGAALNAAPANSLAPTPIPNGATKLEFNATQETWVNVTDANGRELYSKIIFAGSRESIDVKTPVNVTVGNAGGTSMSMNGKPVELAPHSRNNVAHIKLNN